MPEPLRVLSLGAGVQSSTVLLMSCAGELPKLDHAIFADTGWEPAAVYRHLDWLERQAVAAGIVVHRVSAGDLRSEVLSQREGRRAPSLPYHLASPRSDGMMRRQCTATYKIEPIQLRVAELIGLRPRQRRPQEPMVEMWIGISADEAQRMRTSAQPWITNRYPLIYDARMRRADCLDWIAARGYPTPPRSSCIGCPFHSDAEWRRMRDDDPVAWADAVGFDAAIRRLPRIKADAYLHRQRVPLDQVDLSTAEERGQLSMFGNECSGTCGV